MVSGICDRAENLFWKYNALGFRLKNGHFDEGGRNQWFFGMPLTFVTRLIHSFGGFVSS
jgi:hypothetical protein